MLTSLEVSAGGGGTALGLEQAGFDPVALIDSNAHSCATLRQNRPARRYLAHKEHRASKHGLLEARTEIKIVASLRRAFTIGTGPCFVWGTWENRACSVNGTASWFPLLKPSLI